jgi:hypothetical protein
VVCWLDSVQHNGAWAYPYKFDLNKPNIDQTATKGDEQDWLTPPQHYNDRLVDLNAKAIVSLAGFVDVLSVCIVQEQFLVLANPVCVDDPSEKSISQSQDQVTSTPTL